MSIGLAARTVTRTFANGSGVTAIDLEVRSGEIVALVGLNGAGKTTVMRLLLGMLQPGDGSVELEGIPLARVASAGWARVGHLVEAPLAYPELTTRMALELNARLRGVADPGPIVDRALDEFVLRAYEHRRIRALSLGNLQRVGLAAALQHAPAVVVLDEPTNGLDPAGVILLRDRLRALRAAGAAILVSSHHLDEVARVADRIVVINAGRMIGELDPREGDLERVFFDTLLHDDGERAS
jgi:ABC-2 type transport system ATP-binding protein